MPTPLSGTDCCVTTYILLRDLYLYIFYFYGLYPLREIALPIFTPKRGINIGFFCRRVYYRLNFRK
jgi:hypothetical protein